MTIVPMIAMFSHKIPNEMRTACKKIVLAPINYFSDMILHQSAAGDTTLELTDFDEAPNMPLLVKGERPLRKPDVSDIATGAFTVQHRQRAQASTTELRDRLNTAGVRRLIIKPATDRNNWYHGSCRLAVDAEGELQRLFHAHASSESAVLESLFEQARRWQEKCPLNVATNPAVDLLQN